MDPSRVPTLQGCPLPSPGRRCIKMLRRQYGIAAPSSVTPVHHPEDVQPNEKNVQGRRNLPPTLVNTSSSGTAGPASRGGHRGGGAPMARGAMTQVARRGNGSWRGNPSNRGGQPTNQRPTFPIAHWSILEAYNPSSQTSRRSESDVDISMSSGSQSSLSSSSVSSNRQQQMRQAPRLSDGPKTVFTPHPNSNIQRNASVEEVESSTTAHGPQQLRNNSPLGRTSTRHPQYPIAHSSVPETTVRVSLIQGSVLEIPSTTLGPSVKLVSPALLPHATPPPPYSPPAASQTKDLHCWMERSRSPTPKLPSVPLKRRKIDNEEPGTRWPSMQSPPPGSMPPPSSIPPPSRPPLPTRLTRPLSQPVIKVESTRIPVKSESLSPEPEPLASRPELVTGSCTRFLLPEECLKTNPAYKENRQRFVKEKAQEIRRLGLQRTKIMLRDDGLVIEWMSPVPVWSDTYLPEDVEVVDGPAPSPSPSPAKRRRTQETPESELSFSQPQPTPLPLTPPVKKKLVSTQGPASSVSGSHARSRSGSCSKPPSSSAPPAASSSRHVSSSSKPAPPSKSTSKKTPTPAPASSSSQPPATTRTASSALSSTSAPASTVPSTVPLNASGHRRMKARKGAPVRHWADGIPKEEVDRFIGVKVVQDEDEDEDEIQVVAVNLKGKGSQVSKSPSVTKAGWHTQSQPLSPPLFQPLSQPLFHSLSQPLSRRSSQPQPQSLSQPLPQSKAIPGPKPKGPPPPLPTRMSLPVVKSPVSESSTALTATSAMPIQKRETSTAAPVLVPIPSRLAGNSAKPISADRDPVPNFGYRVIKPTHPTVIAKVEDNVVSTPDVVPVKMEDSSHLGIDMPSPQMERSALHVSSAVGDICAHVDTDSKTELVASVLRSETAGNEHLDQDVGLVVQDEKYDDAWSSDDEEEPASETELWAVEYLQRYLQLFDYNRLGLGMAYAKDAMFSCRVHHLHRPSYSMAGLFAPEPNLSTIHRPYPNALTVTQGRLQIMDRLLTMGPYVFCPRGQGRTAVYDVVSHDGHHVLVKMHGEVASPNAEDPNMDHVLTLDQSFVLRRKSAEDDGDEIDVELEYQAGDKMMGAAGPLKREKPCAWPLVAVSHQMTVREGALLPFENLREITPWVKDVLEESSP